MDAIREVDPRVKRPRGKFNPNSWGLWQQLLQIKGLENSNKKQRF